jgi:transposase-like protein
MLHHATIESLPKAMRIINTLKRNDLEWSEDYRLATREALKQIIEDRMASLVDVYLQEMVQKGEVDRRNGSYSRHLLTELGNIELHVPRTRTFSAMRVVRAYARRVGHVDRMILSCFVLGLSTRKVAEALLPVLGERVSPATVSRVAKTLDAAVSAFHRRRIAACYRVLLLDGVVLARKTGAGALRRPVLVALGIRKDGRKEIIDFRLAPGESEAAWESFLSDLCKRGLTEESLELIVLDGGKGSIAALSTVYPGVPVQRCWAHKTRNILDKVRKADGEKVKRDLHKISHAKNRVHARKAARQFADRWVKIYPKAVACLRQDLDELLEFFHFDDPAWRKATRTTNAIERRFREVRRRTRPMGVFSDRTSIERILFAVFVHENRKEGTGTPLIALTQTI